MGSRTTHYLSEAPYLNYSSEAERDNAEIFSESARQSYIEELIHSFNDKYLFEFTMRADATARYSVEGRWGYFPSAKFLHGEFLRKFCAGNSNWNNLKLRMSYGVMGNDGVSNFDFLTGYNIANGFYIFR